MVWAVNGSVMVVGLAEFAHLTIESFDLFVEVGEWLDGVLDLLEVVELAGTVEEFERVTVIVVAIFGEAHT